MVEPLMNGEAYRNMKQKIVASQTNLRQNADEAND